MTTFYQKLTSYAELAIKVGVNIQPNQYLYISASTDTVEFVRLLTEKAYDAGAKQVFVDFSDDELTRLRYENAPSDSFEEYPVWKTLEREKLAEKGAAFMTIVSQSPDLLQGIAPSRIDDFQQATGKALDNFRQDMQSDKFSWTVIAAPSRAWAAKVFPELPESSQVNELWEAIFKAVRANTDNPVQSWLDHDIKLQEKVNYLNEKNYKALTYLAPGTELTIELPKNHVWCGAGSINVKGHSFMANMPTEEVFTAPLKTGVNGFVTSTKPLSFGGNIINNFKITFKEGRVTAISAEQGQEFLQRLIDTDEGAQFIGEVALVPHDSPISQSNILFYNTLFDENASNHLALGSAYPFCIKEGKTMTREQLKEAGLNRSITHVDFMIGSNEMEIDGVNYDGTTEAIFRNGNWA